YRYADPGLQRWLSRDPIAERGGINLFTFNFNNPIGIVDPNGLYVAPPAPCPIPIIVATQVILGTTLVIINQIPPMVPPNPGPIVTSPPGTPNAPPHSISCPQTPDPICYFDPNSPPFPKLTPSPSP